MSHTPQRLAAIAAIAFLGSLCPVPTAAGDLNSEVNKMFNDLGAYGNYTAPGAFRGQSMNTYTGGNLMLRAPTKSYSIASIQWPSVKGGCGGIDAFAGSFSHISAAEFRDMLKKITSALPGVAFQLALSSVSPLLGEKTQWMQTIEQALTRGHINSCEMATTLVKSGADAMGFDSMASCKRVAISMGLAADESEAARKCQQNPNNILNTGANSGNPSVKAMLPFKGNLMWEALNRVQTGELDDNARMLIMSLTGTVVYGDATEENNGTRVVAPTITSIRDLLYGRADTGSGGNVFLGVLSCNASVSCTDVQPNPNFIYKPITKIVEEKLYSLSDKIKNRSMPTPQEIGFVNTVTEPVYRILSVGNTIEGSGLSDQLIAQYKDVIAIDYAHTFLERSLKIGLSAMGSNFKLNKTQQEHEAMLRQRISDALREIAMEKQIAYTKVQTFSTVAGNLEQVERQLRTSMAPHIMELVGKNTGSTK